MHFTWRNIYRCGSIGCLGFESALTWSRAWPWARSRSRLWTWSRRGLESALELALGVAGAVWESALELALDVALGVALGAVWESALESALEWARAWRVGLGRGLGRGLGVGFGVGLGVVLGGPGRGLESALTGLGRSSSQASSTSACRLLLRRLLLRRLSAVASDSRNAAVLKVRSWLHNAFFNTLRSRRCKYRHNMHTARLLTSPCISRSYTLLCINRCL